MTQYRIYLVADDPLVRSSLSMMLDNHPTIVVIGQFPSHALLDEEVTEYDGVDALVWDLGWESEEQLPNLAAFDLPVAVLAPDDVDAQQLWQHGCRAILSRQVDIDQLAAALQAIIQGLWIFDPLIVTTGPVVSSSQPLEIPEDLTPREMEVLQLLTEGLTNKAIAQRLNISNHTVKFHVNAIMTKLNAQSRTDAVVRATRLGLLLL